MRALTAGPDGKRLFGLSEDGTFVDVRETQEMMTLVNSNITSDDANMTGAATAMSLSRDGSRLYYSKAFNAGYADGADPESGQHDLAVKGRPVWGTVAAAPDGKRCYLGSESTAANNRAETPYVVALGPADGEQSTLLAVASPTKNPYRVNLLLSDDGTTLYAWNANTEDPLVAIDTTTMAVTARSTGRAPSTVALHPDGHLYTVDRDRDGVILDPDTFADSGTFPCAPDSAPVLAFGPDGALLVAQGDGTCTVMAPGAIRASGPVRLTGGPVAAVAAMPTECPQRDEPKYMARFKQDGMTCREIQDGVLRQGGAIAKGTGVPQSDKTIEGGYRLIDDGVWRPWSLSGYKYFYRIPDWENLLVDGDDLTWES
ncbi:WD40 repeat domain-containing protein [Streptomyces brevispora]|uniref:WD40 repeat domain-containing protein n=1 Tax=Streptomyces brevispora TaxID=887462 RepID=UPI00371EF9F0